MTWIEGFKTGTHTSASGLQRTWSDADLDEMAATYNPELTKSPVVIGHPSHNSPAWGWIDEIKKSGDKLIFKINEVDQEFKQWVNDRRFQNVSVSLYPPDSPSSPTPGKWYIRHIGFLGGVAPAVKGLNTNGFPAFSDSQLAASLDFIEIELTNPEELINPYIKPETENLMATKTKNKPTEDVDDVETKPDEDSETVEDELNDSATELEDPKSKATSNKQTKNPTKNTDMSEPTATPPITPSDILAANFQFSEKQREIDDRDRKLAQREAVIAQREAEFQREKVTAFCDGLVNDAKLSPGHRDYQIEFMLSMIGDEVVNFADGIKQAPLDYHMSFLNSLPAAVEFKELVTPANSPKNNPTQPPTSTTINFNLPPGYHVDPDQAELYGKILSHQQANNVSFAEAYSAVSSHQ